MPDPRSSLHRFLAELKRRKVFHVAVVYGATMFAVWQIADVAFEPLGLPSWAMTLVIVFSLLGFPLALVLAWAFEITPEGVRRTGAPATGESAAAIEGPPLPQRRSVLIVVGILVVLSGAWVVLIGDAEEPADLELDAGVVALFPFRVGGAEPSLEYLEEGMMDLLAAKLNGDVGPRALDPRAVLSRLGPDPSRQEVSPDSAASVARRLGAGRLLMGSVVGSREQLTVSSSLLDASEGRSEATATVSGPADSLPRLVDRLVAAILSLEAGEAEQRLEALTSASPPALREYLEARRLYRQGRYRAAAEAYQKALQMDSTFALAGIGLSEAVAMGTGPGSPSGGHGLELAWAARDRLGPADREYLALRRGPDGPSGVEESIRRWEHATSVLPDRAEVWYELGDRIFHRGSLLDIHDHLNRSAAAFDRAVALDSALFVALQHRHWVAEMQNDTAGVRRLIPLLSARSPAGFSAALLRWSEASLQADSVALRELRAALDTAGFDEALVLHFQGAYWKGAGDLGIAEADRALDRLLSVAQTEAERRRATSVARAFALNRGRPGEALRIASRAPGGESDPISDPRSRILDALYWDGDAAVGQEAADRISRRVGHRRGAERLETPEDFLDLCALAQWRLWHGSAGSVEGATTALRGEAAHATGIGMYLRLCASVLDVLATRTSGRGPDLRQATLALDSVLRTGPPVGDMRRQGNMILARIFEELGDHRRAYAAAGRVEINWGIERYFVPRLRQTGRLAVLNGDRGEAIRAYRLYLEFRDEPEPHLRAQTDSVRAELAALSGQRPRQ